MQNALGNKRVTERERTAGGEAGESHPPQEEAKAYTGGDRAVEPVLDGFKFGCLVK